MLQAQKPENMSVADYNKLMMDDALQMLKNAMVELSGSSRTSSSRTSSSRTSNRTLETVSEREEHRRETVRKTADISRGRDRRADDNSRLFGRTGKMSGIYIKGLKMPKYGQRLKMFVEYNGQVIIDKKTYFEEYEAITVPDHGRLIDADEQIERAWRLKLDKRELIAEMLESAPTVIPADGGKT